MEGNLMCSSCGHLPADTLCFCNFPLTHLCSQCLTKHRSLPKFHFEMPIAVAAFVTKDNFNECQDWLFRLSRAQLALRENLTALEAFEEEMEGVFHVLIREIEVMKEEFRNEIRAIRGKVGEMIQEAIMETTSQALNPEPGFFSPLSEWVWWRSHPGHSLDLRLYNPSIQIQDKAGILKLLSVEMNKLSPLLPELPLYLQPVHKPSPVISGPQGFVSIEPLFNPLPLSEPKVLKPTNCKVCQAAFTFEDLAYQCTGSCRCKSCAIEALAETNSSICRFCFTAIPPSVFNLVNRGVHRCHICGIALEEQELEHNAKCLICCRCTTVEIKEKFMFFKAKKGRCRLCKDEAFEINEMKYAEMKSKQQIWGCCEKATGRDTKLDCGHYVCSRHEEHLRSCRACQAFVVPKVEVEPGSYDLLNLE